MERSILTGKECTVKQLVAETKAITNALKRYNLQPIGYDPGVVAIDMEVKGRVPVEIPTWFLKRLMEH